MSSKKSLVIISIIIISLVCCLVVAKYFPWQTAEPKPQIDIWNEIERVNEGRGIYQKYEVHNESWPIAKKTSEAQGVVLVRMDGWTEFKQSMKQNYIIYDTLYLDETNNMIWYYDFGLLIYCHY